jgi:hypothetical protein
VRNEGEVTLTAPVRFHQWWRDDTAHDQKQDFVRISARHIARATGDPEPQILDGITRALDAYTDSVETMAQRRKAYQTRTEAQIAVAQGIPVFRQAWHGMEPFRDELVTLAKCAVAFDQAEIHAIASTIRAYHRRPDHGQA